MRRILALALCTLSVLACRNNAPEPAPQSAPIAPPLLDNAPSALPAGHPPLPQGHPPIAPGQQLPTAAQGGAPAAPEGTTGPGALQWNDPPGWQRQTPASSMRAAQYAVPGPAGEVTLAVFYFGEGQGGSIEDNLQRWWGQFEQPDGRPSAQVATRTQRTVGTLRVTVTTLTGRSAGGGMMGGPAPAPQENQMLLGAIVETPRGPWFFKMTGARATVEAARPAFDALLDSARVNP
jgi:hypothetical protein